MTRRLITSAISKMNGTRNHASPAMLGYGELRDEVAALVRPERVPGPSASLIQPRPIVETAAGPTTIKSDRREAPVEDLGTAFDILGRATSCFDLLAQKLEQVGGERDDALAQVEDHKRAASSWQEMIGTVQARMRAQDTEEQKTYAQKGSLDLCDKVIAAFGAASVLDGAGTAMGETAGSC